MSEKELPACGKQAGGGVNGSVGNGSFCNQNTTTEAQSQAPDGDLEPYLKDGLIWIGGQHVCSLRDGVLGRTLDFRREMLHGAVYFRRDILELARDAGAVEVLLTEKSSKVHYRVSLGTLLKRGRPYEHERFGSQLGLPLIQFEWLPSARDMRQLALWEREHV